MPGYTPVMEQTQMIGNDYKSDDSMGFKNEVSSILNNYTRKGVGLSSAMEQVLTSPTARAQFLDSVM